MKVFLEIIVGNYFGLNNFFFIQKNSTKHKEKFASRKNTIFIIKYGFSIHPSWIADLLTSLPSVLFHSSTLRSFE